MSQENVEGVRRAFQAVEIGDRSSFPEAVAKLIFDEIPSVLEGRSYELLELQDLGDDAVLSVFRAKGKAASSGVQVEQVFVQIVSIRDGKVIESRSYTSKAKALEAAGVSE